MAIFLAISCKKQNDWLDVPKSKNDLQLESLKDFQDLLNNTKVFNQTFPMVGQLGTDNYYVKDANLSKVTAVEKNAYLWEKNIYDSKSSPEYLFAYQAINYSNVILELIDGIEIKPYEHELKMNIIGQALFFRAYYFHELASIYCKQYEKSSANAERGLCLKLGADINAIVKRSSLQETYDRIMQDAYKAKDLLPLTSNFSTQPNRIALFAFIARIALNMGDYKRAKDFADSVLEKRSELIDFNIEPKLTLTFRFPDFKAGNREILFYGQGTRYALLAPNDNPNYGLVDTSLYRTYHNEDLRKLFFYSELYSNTIKFLGSYTGNATNFAGIGLNEVYFIKAECMARLGEVEGALSTLNSILVKRFKKGKFNPIDVTDADSLLNMILLERRKEFPMTGQLRWQDLKRLNLDNKRSTILIRKIAERIIYLQPNDPKYVYPFPQDEIELSGIDQNPR
ncbi:RagB/SusD family nutrient uptake outer membrane protein [Chitinophaga sp. NPDC101104]|uniref:RagB/SusD family nutrient uptake outer membrane protein n=1 Tax=Chitinophaga sp. NPDC101104 TaxID=3390561 RepID=UPI003D028B15